MTARGPHSAFSGKRSVRPALLQGGAALPGAGLASTAVDPGCEPLAHGVCLPRGAPLRPASRADQRPKHRRPARSFARQPVLGHLDQLAPFVLQLLEVLAELCDCSVVM